MRKNTRIILQRATVTRSDRGQEVKTWTTYATVMGSPHMLRGAAYYAAQQTVNETRQEYFIHYRTDVQADDRAIINGQTFEITGPPENVKNRNRELLLRVRSIA